MSNGHDAPAADRVCLALQSAMLGQGLSDAAVLIRQALRVDDVRRGVSGPSSEGEHTRAWLDVPRGAGALDRVPWHLFGLEVGDQGTHVRVRARPWVPDWIDLGRESAVDRDVSDTRVVRREESVRGDPFLSMIDEEFRTYRTPGQRTAVRSALLAEPGSTLVVNLPTGGGKTLAMLAPAVLQPADGSTSIVVVPTVALALDQERRYANQHPGSPPTAYHGELSPSEKSEFVRRISIGAQPVVFTNPEAVVTALSRPLTDVAAGGRLRLLAVDEAHVVSSWGDGFRPNFHALAGFRTHLLRESVRAGHEPFRTILASATLTEDTLKLLQALFGAPGPFDHIGAPMVRPEPTFWATPVASSDVRDERLLETLRHLPRPAIVYTTLRDERTARPDTLTPDRLSRLAATGGFRRFAVVDGASSTSKREHVLGALRDTPDAPASVDLVFATSAFGLGIDVPDIKTVVHACVPEGLDRYYQEVGRAGRDGRPSISIVLPTSGDMDVASSLASPRYITADRARDRWNAMIRSAEFLEGGLVRLPLTAVPTDLDAHTDYNERWNLFTVSLLARAGALSWDFSLAGHSAEPEQMRDDRGWLTVRLLRGDHQAESFWSGVVEPVRSASAERGGEGLQALKSAMSGRDCAGALIAQHYTLQSPDFATVCLPSCGGCGYCRASGRGRWSSPSPRPKGIELHRDMQASKLYGLATKGRWGPRLIVGLRSEDCHSQRRMRRVVRTLLAAGQIRLLVVPQSVADAAMDWLPGPSGNEAPTMLMELEDFDPVSEVGVPTLAFIPEGVDPSLLLEGSSRSSLVVVLVPDELCSGKDERPVMDMDAAYRIEDLEQVL
ncbi:protein DpdF [Ilumatobacter fluminis]|nr:protein DpdF [Ilumatobacter fluminis]